MRTIRVLIVDDQMIICEGLRALIETQTDIMVVGIVGNGIQAYEQTIELKPDVVLMDIRMPEMDGVEATRLIKKDLPGTIIIMLTTFDDDEFVINAMSYGASGYLLKDFGSQKLIEAIHDGIRGNIILPGRIAAKITSRLTEKSIPEVTLNDFSVREIEIINLIIQNKNNKEIAQELHLSIGTVKNYISQIYLKINVKDRLSAVLFFKEMGLKYD